MAGKTVTVGFRSLGFRVHLGVIGGSSKMSFVVPRFCKNATVAPSWDYTKLKLTIMLNNLFMLRV